MTMRTDESVSGRWRSVAGAVVAAVAVLACAAACRSLPPNVDDDESARGTVAGRVHGPEGIAPVEGRLVEAVELDTGRRLSAHTNSLGDYSLLVPPGRYRIEVVLGPGEEVVKSPGVVEVGPSELVPDVDLGLGGAGVAVPD